MLPVHTNLYTHRCGGSYLYQAKDMLGVDCGVAAPIGEPHQYRGAIRLTIDKYLEAPFANMHNKASFASKFQS